LYKIKIKIGQTIPNWFVGRTLGKQFTAGSTIASAREKVLSLNTNGFSSIINHLAELRPGHYVPESEFDMNMVQLEQGIRSCFNEHLKEKNSTAVKYTGYCNLNTLAK